MIICSTFMDILQFAQLYRFVFHGTTWRIWFAIIVFYGFRALVQAIVIFEFPKGYNWGYPGWYSPFVPYGQTADFFFSGHVGICVLHGLEFWAVGWKLWTLYSAWTGCCQVVLMLSTRAHYSIDMIAGVIFAHYIYMMVEKYIHLFDFHILGIPLEKRFATVN